MTSYVVLDVFTDRPYAGNPLAVVVDPPSLTTEAMQAVAGEMNLSETVFLSPRDDGWDTRIFTERQQMLTAVCESPVLLERRLFELARAIQPAP